MPGCIFIRARATEESALPTPRCRTQCSCWPHRQRDGAAHTLGGRAGGEADVTVGMGTMDARTSLSLNSSLKNLVNRRRKHFHRQDGLFGKEVRYLPIFIQ